MVSQVELLFWCAACYHFPSEKEGRTMDIKSVGEFAKLYYIKSHDVQILVVTLLESSQQPSVEPDRHSDTVDKDE